MANNRDFNDLFCAFNAADVRYLVVGAYAVTFHAQPRFTQDLDVWIDATSENADRAFRALAQFGAPLREVSEKDFATAGTVVQLGVAPNRIDILTAIDGVAFGDAWTRRVKTAYGETPIAVLSRADLIRNKKAVGRPQDLLDVAALERTGDRSGDRGS